MGITGAFIVPGENNMEEEWWNYVLKGGCVQGKTLRAQEFAEVNKGG